VYKAKVPMLVRNDKDVTFQDGWLAGFTDSEGCFTVTILKRLLKSSTYYNQVQVRYILSQKQEFKLMSQIARLTGGKTHLLKKYCFAGDKYGSKSYQIKTNYQVFQCASLKIKEKVPAVILKKKLQK
jgi:hypothetical protein